MTIAICIKVHDGVVLAADSAATVFFQTDSGYVEQVYIYANKVFNIYKSLPVGMVTWGHGGIGQASTSTLVKDFRKLLTEDEDWKVDPKKYSLKEIAEKFKLFIRDLKYKKEIGDPKDPNSPFTGFLIAGYSANSDHPEVWELGIGGGIDWRMAQVNSPIVWAGEKEIISRIILGYSEHFPFLLKELSVPDEDIQKILEYFDSKYNIPLVHPAMPIQDAIDLADFLVDTAIKYARFRPGAPSIGGPIEIAAITKHEGFKWVKRKHYYRRELNPE